MKTAGCSRLRKMQWSTSTVNHPAVFSVKVNQTALFKRSMSTILLFSWSTSTRLLCRQDCSFQIVDINHCTFHLLGRRLMLVNIVDVHFYCSFHHAQFFPVWGGGGSFIDFPPRSVPPLSSNA